MRHLLIAALLGAALSLVSSPSRALEQIVLRLPFLETSVTINLADLQMAGDTRVYELIDKVFLIPLPVETKALLQGATGQPLLEQALWAATQLVELEDTALNASGRMLTDALVVADEMGQPNVLGFPRLLL